MTFSGAKVRIIDVTPLYISFKYLSSNVRCRIERRTFVIDFQTGKIDVTNHKMLDK